MEMIVALRKPDNEEKKWHKWDNNVKRGQNPDLLSDPDTFAESNNPDLNTTVNQWLLQKNIPAYLLGIVWFTFHQVQKDIGHFPRTVW